MKRKFMKCIMRMKNLLSKIVPHRVLALNRGEKEDILRVCIKPDVEFYP